MNGYQRIKAALGGERPDRTPVMLHNFMMAAREAGLTMREFRENPGELARAFIESVEKYEYDGILLDVDTATLAGAVGVPVDFPEDLPARHHGGNLTSLEEVDDLRPADIRDSWQVQVWLEAARLLKAHFGDEVFVRGNCDQAPFSLACSMRSVEGWLLDLTDEGNLERIEKLLDYCADVTTQFIRLMAATGVHMVSNGDSNAGPEMISPRMYRAFALRWEKRVVECAHAAGLPYVLHICGKTDLILEDMLATGADGFELDYKTGVRRARDTFGDRAAFLGNIDPSGVLALGTPQLVAEKTRELLDVFANSPRFILNAGCAIPANTPPENLRAMIRAAVAP